MFEDQEYLIRRKVLKLFGGAFHMYDAQQRLVAYCKLKAFKLKEDLRVYADESEAQELFNIQARQVIDFGATYDVVDSATGVTMGALRRKGFKSMLRDEWALLAPDEREIGSIQEDSAALALVRRFATNIIPQGFHCIINGAPAMALKQNWNPFVLKIRLAFDQWPEDLDRRMAVAAGILLCAIEGRQN